MQAPAYSPSPPSWESYLSGGLFNRDVDKTFVDKVLDRQGVERLKEIMRKDVLNREDLLELLYLMGAVEAKLVNFGEWDRYLLGKYYAWIRDFVASAELHYDLLDAISKGEVKVSAKAMKMLNKIKYMLNHDIKFLVDVYFFLARSTLSLGATGFDTLTKSRFEYFYPQQQLEQKQEGRRISFNPFQR